MGEVLLRKIFKVETEQMLHIPLPNNIQGEVDVEIRIPSSRTPNNLIIDKQFDALEIAGLHRFFSEKDDENIDWEEVFGVKSR